MSWIDDLQVRVDQAKKWSAETKAEAGKILDIGSYIGSVVTEATVKSGAAAKGNLTQKELDAGIRGDTGAVPDSDQQNAPGIMNSNIGLEIMNKMKQNALVTTVIVGGLVYFIAKKGKIL